MKAKQLRLFAVALVAAATSIAVHGPAAQAEPGCVQKGTALTESVGAVTGRMRSEGATDAEVEAVMANDWCIQKIGSGSSATPVSAMGDDGGVGATDVTWTTSLWYETSTGYYYAMGNWTWNNHDYASDVGMGCWAATVGGLDAIGLRLGGGGNREFDITYAALSYWGDPALNSFDGNFGFTEHSGVNVPYATSYGVEYVVEDKANRLYNGNCYDRDMVDFNLFGGQVIFRFVTMDGTCFDSKVYAGNWHTWSSTSVNAVGAGYMAFSVGWVNGASGHPWSVFGASGKVCGRYNDSGLRAMDVISTPTGGTGGSNPPVALKRDFSGDGKADIVARNGSTKDLHLFKGNGAGGFQSGTGAAFSNNWSAYDTIFSAGDFSGDGKADIVARNGSTKDLYLYKGNGSGGFINSTGIMIGNNWSAYDTIFSAGDFSGDGKADIIARNGSTKDLYLYKGNGSGGFINSTGIMIGNNWGAFDTILSPGDFSGDGKTDLIARDGTSQDLYLYRGNGAGGFLTSSGVLIGNNWSGLDKIFSVGDFSGDGKNDIIARNKTTMDLYLYKGSGSGGFVAGAGVLIGNNWSAFDRLF